MQAFRLRTAEPAPRIRATHRDRLRDKARRRRGNRRQRGKVPLPAEPSSFCKEGVIPADEQPRATRSGQRRCRAYRTAAPECPMSPAPCVMAKVWGGGFGGALDERQLATLRRNARTDGLRPPGA